MKKLFLLISLSILILPHLFAQGKAVYTVEGKVTSKNTGEPIPFAQVLIKETSQWGVSDENGVFKIPGIFSGNYTFQAVVLGYVNYELPIKVTRDITGLSVQMLEDNLKLEEVVVTATKGGTINSSNKIDKKAIEHVQASSIADVMQLLPGGVIKNPKLTEANKVQIRSLGQTDALSNEARGVGFLVNGTQISNDASMSGVVKSGEVASSFVDFRNYSTDNIESIEVIKGVVSAEYGDVTSGAVLVTTKAGRTPFEVRFKTDPLSKAVAANKGFALSKKGGYMNVDMDYARATTDPRSPVVTFNRANVGLTYSNTFNTDSRPFRFNARLSGSFISNSAKSDPDVAKEDFTKSRTNNIMLSLYGNWMLNKSWISTLNYNVSANYSYNTDREYTVAVGNRMPTTNSKEEGIHVGYFTDTDYRMDQRTEDIPLYVNAKLSGVLNKKAGNTLFKTTLGVEWNSKGNLGDGVWYEGFQPQYFRHHPYKHTPFMHDFSAFLEEKVIIPISKTSLELSAGLRFDKMMLEGYNYDPTLDPRLNAKYFLIKNRRKALVRSLAVRGGWGIMRKLPSLALLYPGEVYLDRAVFQYYNTASNESLAVINTRILPEILDYNLASMKTRNMEVGVDMNLGGVDIGITYFNEYMKDGISENNAMTMEQLKYYDNVSGADAAPKFEDGKVWIKDKSGNYVEAPGKTINEFIKKARPDNRREQKKWGIEYELNFGKIKPVNTSVIVNGAYIKSNSSTGGLVNYYSGDADPLDAKNKFPYVGIYAGNGANMCSGNTSDRLSTNISFVTNIPKIRMVVTLTTQCIWMERSWNNFDKSVYSLDGNGNRVFEDLSKKSTDKVLYRDPVAYMDFNGNVRPFSDYYTTKDSDLKARLAAMRLTTSQYFYYAVQTYNPYFMANLRITKEIGNIAAISFYANNFTNSRPIMVNNSRPNETGVRKNTDIYFGAELRLTF